MKALIPFTVYFLADGVATVFTLDTSKDPYYYAVNSQITFSTDNAVPVIASLSPQFDPKIGLTSVNNVQAQNAQNGGSLGTPTVTLDQNQITFTFSTAPTTSNGTFIIFGFLQY